MLNVEAIITEKGGLLENLFEENIKTVVSE